MPKSKRPDKRDWQPREQRLVSEFVARFYPGYESSTHVHLGSTPPRLKGKFTTDAEARLVGVFRRWADALVFLPDRVVLIEGKILPPPGYCHSSSYTRSYSPRRPSSRSTKVSRLKRSLCVPLRTRSSPSLPGGKGSGSKYLDQHGLMSI